MLDRARAEPGSSMRLGAAPGRFCLCGRSERPGCPGRRGELPGRPSPLCGRLGGDEDDFPNELERLGISTLGRLAGLPRDAVGDRFGRLGRARAWRAARTSRCGRGPCGRRSPSSWSCRARQRSRGAELLISRLLAHPSGAGGPCALPALRPAGGRRWVAAAGRAAASERGGRWLSDALPPPRPAPGPGRDAQVEAVALGRRRRAADSLGTRSERRRRISRRSARPARGRRRLALRVLEVDPGAERREVLMPFPEEST